SRWRVEGYRHRNGRIGGKGIVDEVEWSGAHDPDEERAAGPTGRAYRALLGRFRRRSADGRRAHQLRGRPGESNHASLPEGITPYLEALRSMRFDLRPDVEERHGVVVSHRPTQPVAQLG